MDKPSIRASDARLGIAFRDQEILTSRYYIRAGRGKLSQQMAAQGTMLERFVAAGRGRPDGTWDDIEFRLWRIATETVIGEIRVTDGNSVQDLDALWVVNLDRELAAAARRVVVQTRCRRLRAVRRPRRRGLAAIPLVEEGLESSPRLPGVTPWFVILPQREQGAGTGGTRSTATRFRGVCYSALVRRRTAPRGADVADIQDLYGHEPEHDDEPCAD